MCLPDTGDEITLCIKQAKFTAEGFASTGDSMPSGIHLIDQKIAVMSLRAIQNSKPYM